MKFIAAIGTMIISAYLALHARNANTMAISEMSAKKNKSRFGEEGAKNKSRFGEAKKNKTIKH